MRDWDVGWRVEGSGGCRHLPQLPGVGCGVRVPVLVFRHAGVGPYKGNRTTYRSLRKFKLIRSDMLVVADIFLSSLV